MRDLLLGVLIGMVLILAIYWALDVLGTLHGIEALLYRQLQSMGEISDFKAMRRF